jgi:hypothetical protein
MTANPNWPEIQEQLLWEVPPTAGANHRRRKQKASDRPDIVARVFEEKKNALLNEIKDGIIEEQNTVAIRLRAENIRIFDVTICLLPIMRSLLSFLETDQRSAPITVTSFSDSEMEV